MTIAKLTDNSGPYCETRLHGVDHKSLISGLSEPEIRSVEYAIHALSEYEWVAELREKRLAEMAMATGDGRSCVCERMASKGTDVAFVRPDKDGGGLEVKPAYTEVQE